MGQKVNRRGSTAIVMLVGGTVAGVGLSDAQPKPMGPPNTTIPPVEALRLPEKIRTTGTLPPQAVREMESWTGPDGRRRLPPMPVMGPDGKPEMNPDGSLYLYDPEDPKD